MSIEYAPLDFYKYPLTKDTPIYPLSVETPPLNDVQEQVKNSLLFAIENGEILVDPATSSPYSQKPLIHISEVDRFQLPFGTYMCQDTGLIITSPRLSEKTIAHYYQNFYHPLVYGNYDIKNIKALYMIGQGIKIWNFIKPHLQISNKTLSVLEVGAGVGDVLEDIRTCAIRDDTKIDVIGTEFNTQCIEKARERNIEVIFGGLKQAVELDRKFDLIIMSHVFEHLIDLDEAMNHLRLLLSSDSMLYIEVPGVLSLHRRQVYSFDYIRYTVHAHCYNFNLTSLAYVLSTGGFKLISGNEECEALFIKNKGTNIIEPIALENNAIYIFGYLSQLKKDYKYHKKQSQNLIRLKTLENRVTFLEKTYNTRTLLLKRFFGISLPSRVKFFIKKLLPNITQF